MAIQMRRGLLADLPTLADGEFGIVIDPGAPKVYVGTPSDGNVQVPTTAEMNAAIDALINGAPAALDTLKELSDALGNDDDFAATVTTALAGKEPLIAAKSASNPKNHDRYTDGEAVAAMGSLGDANPLHHDRYDDAEAVTAMGVKGNANPLHHDRYTDVEAVSALSGHTGDADAHHTRYTDSEAILAMGTKTDANPLYHDRYEDSEAVAAMGVKDDLNPLHHDKYTDSDAVTAMGVKDDSNPLHHDKYTDADALAAVQGDSQFLDATGSPAAIPLNTSSVLVYYSGSDDPASGDLPSAATAGLGYSILLHKETSASTGTFTVNPDGSDTINGVAAPLVVASTSTLSRIVVVGSGDWRIF